ncbi:hypothetical protein B0H14DRAFT_3463248 [Mycena olivaceomarginata]|nr:hypothetical protein B0H14DRAFT_3463248 [Mycena olivaceomarginata]
MPLPALGVTGSPVRNDAQRLSTAKPCGSTDIASNLDKATAVPVEADGSTVMLNVTNFNPGADGSRSVSVLVDPTGTGKNFVAAKVTKNGDPAPKTNGSDQVKLTLPAGTKCTGGKAGNLCLLVSIFSCLPLHSSFPLVARPIPSLHPFLSTPLASALDLTLSPRSLRKSTAGFGACTVVSQLSAGSSDSTPSASASAAPASTKGAVQEQQEQTARGGHPRRTRPAHRVRGGEPRSAREPGVSGTPL